MGIVIFITLTGRVKLFFPISPPRARRRFLLPFSVRSEGTIVSGVLLEPLKFKSKFRGHSTLPAAYARWWTNPELAAHGK